MAELQLLRADHAPALLMFERENRNYFAKSVPDRGDDYFEHFDERHAALLAEQAAGLCYFHVIVDDDRILGRVNLVDVADGEAELGFRVAEHATGRGLARGSVRNVFELAVDDYGMTRLRAAATLDNAASRTVLIRTGFTVMGETTLDGQPGLIYTRDLTS